MQRHNLTVAVLCLLFLAGAGIAGQTGTGFVPGADAAGWTNQGLPPGAQDAGWDDDVRLTNNSDPDYTCQQSLYGNPRRHVVVDPSGRIHVAWWADLGGQNPIPMPYFKIFYKRFNPGTGWTRDTVLSTYAGYSITPSMAVDSAGNVHLVWMAWPVATPATQVHYKMCTPEGTGNGGWQTDATSLTTTTPGQVFRVDVACTPDNHVHVVWMDYISGSPGDVIRYREKIDGNWQAVVQVYNDPGGNPDRWPSVAGARNNDVHVAWRGQTSVITPVYQVRYKGRISGNWMSSPEIVSGTVSTNRQQTYPSIACNPTTNEPHVLWRGMPPDGSFSRVIHSRRTASGWQARDTVSEPALGYEQYEPQLVFTPDGRGHAVWHGKSAASPAGNQIRYSERTISGTWRAPVNLQNIGGDRGWASLNNGGNSSSPNDIHAVWEDFRSWGAEIYYKRIPSMAPFELLKPKNDSLNAPIANLGFDWQDAVGTDVMYDLWLGTSNTIPPGTLIAPNLENSSYLHAGPLANNQDYYWRVRAFNAGGEVWSGTGNFHFKTVILAPEPPDLVWPANGAPNQPVAGTLGWRQALRATGYDVYLGVDNPPQELVSPNQPDLTYDYSGLANDETYYWMIVAQNVGGSAPPSEVWNFTTTVAAPEPFTLALPENNAVNVPLTGDLVWNASTRADWYDVYLDENPNPTTKIGTVSAPATILPYTGHVTNGKTYYWKVAARNVGGATASGVWSFTTAVWRDGWTEVKPVPNMPNDKPVKDGAWLAVGPDQGPGGRVQGSGSGHSNPRTLEPLNPSDVIYAAKGNKTLDFYKYYPVENDWTALEDIPLLEGEKEKPPKKGCVGVSDGENYVYMTKGNNTLGFWRYNITADDWGTPLVGVPEGPDRKKVKGGTDMVYVPPRGEVPGYVYLLKGYRNEFYRFNTAANADTWETLQEAPFGANKKKYAEGSFLVYDDDNTIYVHQAKYTDGTNHYMFKFDIPTQTWTETLPGMPVLGREGGRDKKKKSKDGAAGAWCDDCMYALKGGNTEQYWKYTPDEEEPIWTQLESLPLFGSTSPDKKKRVKAGADLVSYGYGAFFALKGNKTHELWRYVIPTTAYGSQPTAESRSGAMAGELIVHRSSFFVSPNPIASGFATVRFSLPKAGSVAVTVFDVAGRSVFATRSLGRLTTGSHPLDLRKLASGVYLVRLDAEGYTTTHKLVVQR